MTPEVALELAKLAVGVGAALCVIIVGLISVLYHNHVKRIERLSETLTEGLKDLHERITEHLERHHTNDGG